MTDNHMSLYQNIKKIRETMQQAEKASARSPQSVLLLAVSKQQSIEAISDAFSLGIHDFGENYYQEAQQKIAALKQLPIIWHFLGPIQSNKTKGIAHSFSWVHSLNRIKIATQLNAHRSGALPPLNVCIQVNLIDEKTKSGIPAEQVAELALAVSQLPNLRLRGLMTIPPPQPDQHKQYQLLLKLQDLIHLLNQQLQLNMDTLSMGMSEDMVTAIHAGSTIVRIGRALFGDRQSTKKESYI